MVDYFTDSANLHIRDSIRLNQSLVDEMLLRSGGFGVTRYFVARHITLDDAVFTDSDVVLVADTVTASAPGRVQITLKHGGTAKAASGVTIDMRGLRGVDVLPGEKHVRIGAGEHWG